MKEEKLFDGITYIDEDLVEEAAQPPRAKWTGLLIALGKVAAVFALIIGAAFGGFYILLSNALGGNGSAGLAPASTSRYSSTVFPLTAISGAEDISVVRELTLRPNPVTGYGFVDTTTVTDSYTLTNPTASDITVELAYPFVGGLYDRKDNVPRVYGEGEELQTELLYGGSIRKLLRRPEDWTEFRDAFETTDYLHKALNPNVLREMSVTRYRICAISAEGEEDARLKISYDMDPALTTVWASGAEEVFTGDQPGTYSCTYGLIHSHDLPGIITVLGPDLENMQTQGYRVTEPMVYSPENELEGVTARIERLDTVTLREYLLGQISDHSDNALSPQGILTAFAEELEAVDYRFSSLGLRSWQDLSQLVRKRTHILYQTFAVTVPAGGSANVSVVLEKTDLPDMVTTLGSNLNFSGQSALLDLGEPGWYRITDQNFGFDPEKGITKVPLDLTQEEYHIYLDRPQE